MKRDRSETCHPAMAVIAVCALLAGNCVKAEDPPKSAPVAISNQPAPVTIERAFANLTFPRPIFLTYPPDGTNRIAVISQYGSILIFPNDDSAQQPDTMLDLSSKIAYSDRENEEGLLGLAFHPNFKQNGQFFIYYVLKNPRHTVVVSRMQMTPDNPNHADSASEEELLRITEPYWNHKGGTLAFGPDGCLYVAVGDGGAANDPHGHGQSMATMMAKVLRIDVDHRDPGKNYAVPKDNPFVDDQGALPEIWALGLRNVWRMAFDRQTGKLWAGDVGQDLWEEVDIIQRGGNYGWNLREAIHDFVPTPGKPFQPGPPPAKISGTPVDPIFEYHHDIGKSITGGCVYRGRKVPELAGAYLFADYVSGKVYALRYDETAGKVTSVEPIEGNVMPVFSFGEDQEGEVYFTTTQGTLHRFRSAPAAAQ